jgi:small subunit ribosomal protein S18b, mitochondrial
MNFLTRVSQQITNYSRISRFPVLKNISSRNLSVTSTLYCENIENPEEKTAIIDESKDRSKIIPVETSIRYLKSSAYATTYGDQPVWVPYRRNFKGPFAPSKTRKTCIRNNTISTGNPCPICRDEYLVLDHRNVELLKQFISEHTGDVS